MPFFLNLLVVTVGLAVTVAPLLILATPILDPPTLLESMRNEEKILTNILISFHPTPRSQDLRATLQTLRNGTFRHRTERLELVTKILKKHAQTSQKNLLKFLTNEEEKGWRKSGATMITVKQLWISNQIIVKNVDFSLLKSLMGRVEILKIEQEKFIPLDPLPHPEEDGDHFVHEGPYQWGVDKIGAPAFYESTKGEGIVIASIDTGARMSHEALLSRYRLEYGWFDPGQVVTRWPYDDQGHGTHTIGTMLGVTEGIGVAPGAQWISCKGCNKDGRCSSLDLLFCGQWVLCPTDIIGGNEDCSQAPHIVSNSWTGPSDGFFDDVIAAWQAVGIIPVFGIGNDGGKGCNTTGYPGNHPDVIGVGAISQLDQIAPFSSVGPVTGGTSDLFKPDVVAPGMLIYSAYHRNDTDYVVNQGTSMACPHVSGLIALMLGKNPDLDFDQIRDILRRSAMATVPDGQDCGGVSQTEYPNHKVGYGRVDGVKIIQVMNSGSTSNLMTISRVSRNGLAFLGGIFLMTIFHFSGHNV